MKILDPLKTYFIRNIGLKPGDLDHIQGNRKTLAAWLLWQCRDSLKRISSPAVVTHTLLCLDLLESLANGKMVDKRIIMQAHNRLRAISPVTSAQMYAVDVVKNSMTGLFHYHDVIDAANAGAMVVEPSNVHARKKYIAIQLQQLHEISDNHLIELRRRLGGMR